MSPTIPSVDSVATSFSERLNLGLDNNSRMNGHPNGQSGGAGPPRKYNSEGSKGGGGGKRSRSNSRKRRGGGNNHRDNRDSMVTPGSAGGFKKGGGNGHYGFRSENKGFERSNSGFSRNNKAGGREDISERITFKAPKTPSPVPEPLLESKEPLLDQEGADQQKVKEEKSSEAGISNNNCEGGMVSAKHPLLHAWTLWHYKNDPRLQWDANLVRVHTFRYAEDFWALYHHLEEACNLGSGQDYCLFKEGVRPAWEDVANREGGRWVIGGLDPSLRSSQLDAMWVEAMLYLIGAESEHESLVNGAVVMVRNRGDKIAVWCRDSSNRMMDIGRELKKRLRIAGEVTIGFENHRDAKGKRGKSGYGTTFMYEL